MKSIIFISLAFFLAISAFSQNKKKVLKSDIVFEQPFKPPFGTSYINPFDFSNCNVNKIKDTLVVKAPFAKRFYPDISALSAANSDENLLRDIIWMDVPTKLAIGDMVKPFYIQNHEVTNAEYRLFLNSLNETEKAKNYPDTTRWQKDFDSLAYNGPMQRYYFDHPHYDNYPVVGVTYFQAKAFCAWLEARYNKGYKLNGARIQVDLPNQFEWAFANGDKYIWLSDGKGPYFENRFYDHNYLTNLNVSLDSNFGNLANRALLPGFANFNTGNFIDDGYLYPAPYHFRKSVDKESMLRSDRFEDVQFMNTNVSEWCTETYQDNWKELYEWRQSALRKLGTREALITADIEAYYNTFNDTISGQMVRGGNWVFEHHALRNGANVGMHDAKLFVNPNESHCTIGFRYVIRIVEEKQTASN